MQKRTQADDVEGLCPQCHHKVGVYARGGKLCIRAHKRNRDNGTGWYDVTCPVTGLDGAEAIWATQAHKDATVASADTAIAKAESVLAEALKRANEARMGRDAYAARAAELIAQTRKGGAP